MSYVNPKNITLNNVVDDSIIVGKSELINALREGDPQRVALAFERLCYLLRKNHDCRTGIVYVGNQLMRLTNNSQNGQNPTDLSTAYFEILKQRFSQYFKI